MVAKLSPRMRVRMRENDNRPAVPVDWHAKVDGSTAIPSPGLRTFPAWRPSNTMMLAPDCDITRPSHRSVQNSNASSTPVSSFDLQCTTSVNAKSLPGMGSRLMISLARALVDERLPPPNPARPVVTEQTGLQQGLLGLGLPPRRHLFGLAEVPVVVAGQLRDDFRQGKTVAGFDAAVGPEDPEGGFGEGFVDVLVLPVDPHLVVGQRIRYPAVVVGEFAVLRWCGTTAACCIAQAPTSGRTGG